MCGTVGLFTGCAAAAFCPVSQLKRTKVASGKRDGGGLPPYRSAFSAWDTKASVRSRPRRELADDGLSLFPADLVPVARHPLVAALPPEIYDCLLTQHLYRYLQFTAKLEYLVVNHVTLGIAHGSIAVPIPDQMRFDAFKIYTDEAYHALFSVDLMRQVEAQTKIRPSFEDEPYFLTRLAALKERHDGSRAQLIEVLFTIVSETLITATLTEVARSQDVASAVVETVHDHALDEGRHHAYFASYLNYLWASLGRKEREFAGRVLPELIDIFLLPDLPATRKELLSYGLGRDKVEQVLAETFSGETQASYARATASKLLGYLLEVGVFEESGARDIAQERGFISFD